MNQPERHRVRAHAKGSPLLAYRLREADDGGLGRGIVCLADITVQTRC